MENENAMDQQDGQQDGVKVFTQAQVDRIVKDRLAKEKEKTARELATRTAEIERRELELDARALLAAKGIPQDLLPAINCQDKETMENSVKLLVEWMLKGKPPMAGMSGPDCGLGIRKAMGL